MLLLLLICKTDGHLSFGGFYIKRFDIIIFGNQPSVNRIKHELHVELWLRIIHL